MAADKIGNQRIQKRGQSPQCAGPRLRPGQARRRAAIGGLYLAGGDGLSGSGSDYQENGGGKDQENAAGVC